MLLVTICICDVVYSVNSFNSDMEAETEGDGSRLNTASVLENCVSELYCETNIGTVRLELKAYAIEVSISSPTNAIWDPSFDCCGCASGLYAVVI